MNKQDLIALAERVEKAEGADRGLDALIAVQTGLYVLEKRGADRKEWFYPIAGGWRRQLHGIAHERLPAFTASLDAAMTLVPEGWAWMAGCAPGDEFFASLAITDETCQAPEVDVNAATPPLALTAASLRAIAEERGDG